jgi:hypothetical protein
MDPIHEYNRSWSGWDPYSKRTPEGFSTKAFIGNSIIVAVALAFILVSWYIPVYFIYLIHGYEIFVPWMIFVRFGQLLIILFPLIMIFFALAYIFVRNEYTFEKGIIHIYSWSSNKPAKEVFFDDIVKIEPVEKIPLMFFFSMDLFRYTQTTSFCYYDEELYLIELKQDYKLIRDGAIVHRGITKKLSTRSVVLPKRIVKKYSKKHGIPDNIKLGNSIEN